MQTNKQKRTTEIARCNGFWEDLHVTSMCHELQLSNIIPHFKYHKDHNIHKTGYDLKTVVFS